MKLRLPVKILIILAPLSLLFLIPGQDAHSNGSGAPAARTGSPGDGSNCRACHSGATPPAVNLISSDIPEEGYTPGATYNITAAVTHSTFNKFGFQISPQNLTGQQRGTMIATDAARTQLISAGKYITHKTAGNAGTANANTWNFQWVAPVAGTGNLTFYGAFVAANANNSNSGDAVFLSTLAVQENTGTVSLAERTNDEGLNIFPIPCSDLLTVKKPASMGESITITILGMDGAEKKKLQISLAAQDLLINVNDLAPGSYTTVIADAEGHRLYKRIVKL